MTVGSYIRFAVGFLLSLSVLASFITGRNTGIDAAFLSLAFIALSILWVVFRF